MRKQPGGRQREGVPVAGASHLWARTRRNIISGLMSYAVVITPQVSNGGASHPAANSAPPCDGSAPRPGCAAPRHSSAALRSADYCRLDRLVRPQRGHRLGLIAYVALGVA